MSKDELVLYLFHKDALYLYKGSHYPFLLLQEKLKLFKKLRILCIVRFPDISLLPANDAEQSGPSDDEQMSQIVRVVFVRPVKT